MYKLLTFLLLVWFGAACTSLPEPSPVNSSSLAQNPYARSLDEAIELANLTTGNLSRNESEYKISYIINECVQNNSRTIETGSDTLAYVLNSEVGGFAVIAYDTRVPSVLAYSDTGTFEYVEDENNLTYSEFIDRLPNYCKNAITNENLSRAADAPFIPITENNDSSVIISPIIPANIHQGNPFNRYVVVDHPNCPAGCAPVAVSMIMVYCKPSLSDYQGYNFNFLGMRTVFRITPNYSSSSTQLTEDAYDNMAKLIYLAGKDMHTQYSLFGSSTYAYYMGVLLEDLGYEIGYSRSYTKERVAVALTDGYLVLMKGLTSDREGHAWVIDGGTYIIPEDNPNQPDYDHAYFHCKWGWTGGYCDGYYYGDVFTVDGCTFNTSLGYTSVKIE